MQSTTKLSEDSISSRLRPSLKNIWLASHLFYAACMLSIPFITTTQAVTIIVCLLGIPWSITIWVPYALIGIEISGIRQAAALGSNTGSLHDSTGAILGVHNAAIALPQILATLGASLIFWGMGNAGLSWVIACGGLAALGAAVMTAGVVEREVDF
jgi:solute carrier family 45 protein 1/2/4